MDNDDRQLGRILSRREVLALLGTGSALLLTGCTTSQPVAATPAHATTQPAPTNAATPEPTLNAEAETAVALESNPTAAATQIAEIATAEVANTAVAAGSDLPVPACVVRPELTEGPYYVDVGLVRSDVRTDSTTGEARPGVPFVLTFNVSQVASGSCAPLEGATVEIWHCDAAGQYSGVSDRQGDSTSQNWLRGAQITDANGLATFTTIYPGWYPGRTVHIHFKVSPGENQVFTSQLFFDDALSQQVFTKEPYAARGTLPDTLNSNDNIYADLLLMAVSPSGDGYSATFDIGIDPIQS